MAYVNPNFKSKKALKEAVANGDKVEVFAPGPLGGPYNGRSKVSVEGPHYPKPHSWYAVVNVDEDGYVSKVVS